MAQEVRTTDQRTPARTETRERTPDRPVFVPPADIYETRDNIVVVAEMPGVAPDGVDITLERRVLTIRGRNAGSEHTGYQRVYNEMNMRMAITSGFSRFRKISTATELRRCSRTVSCTSFCRNRKLQSREKSSSKPRNLG